MSQYKKGDYVNYSANGVCLIFDIGVPDFDKNAQADSYYFLKPVGDKSTTIFVPKGNKLLLSRMRRLLTENEICDAIDAINAEPFEWIDDRKKRIELHSEIFKRNSPCELLRLVFCMMKKREQLRSLGGNRDIALSDIDVLEHAKRMISEEFSFVLGISAPEVEGYILSRLG